MGSLLSRLLGSRPMASAGPTMVVKDLVLIGGGHSHVVVLKSFAMKPMPGVRLTLVTRDVHTPYSGMLPGLVAGHYTYDDCHIDLRPLAQLTNARLLHCCASGLDLDQRAGVLADGRPPIRYDVLSIDIGITPLQSVPGAKDLTLPVKPIDSFTHRWEALRSRILSLAPGSSVRVVVVGGGAGGVELLLAMQHRLQQDCQKSQVYASFVLITRGELLPTHNARVRSIVRRILKERSVKVLDAAVVAVRQRGVESGGERVDGVKRNGAEGEVSRGSSSGAGGGEDRESALEGSKAQEGGQGGSAVQGGVLVLDGGEEVEFDECVWCTQVDGCVWCTQVDGCVWYTQVDGCVWYTQVDGCVWCTQVDGCVWYTQVDGCVWCHAGGWVCVVPRRWMGVCGATQVDGCVWCTQVDGCVWCTQVDGCVWYTQVDGCVWCTQVDGCVWYTQVDGCVWCHAGGWVCVVPRRWMGVCGATQVDGCVWCTQVDGCVWCTQVDGCVWYTQVDGCVWYTQVDGCVWCLSKRLKSGAHSDRAVLVTWPKAGMFAVRQDMPLPAFVPLTPSATNSVLHSLSHNLVVCSHSPTRSTGDKYAVFSRGSLAFEDSLMWTLKDRIDRAFMRHFSQLPIMPSPPLPTIPVAHTAGPEALLALKSIPMRCGGCGSKVGSSLLSRVLTRLAALPSRPPGRPEILLGLDSPDDAAVLAIPPDSMGGRQNPVIVQTVDFFRSFLSDPHTFGRIATLHALTDCFAMGADPVSALAIVTLPYGTEEKMEEELFQVMAGAIRELDAATCQLAGMCEGDAIILTKPIGTGVIFAANMRCKAKKAAAIALQHKASSATDVTGFGLLGHLVEMTRASGVTVTIDPSTVPILVTHWYTW
ncbi:unnamed protein product [Closterium sp. Naga37s-1]|nr:unnamed protein product [Closterium sp. Naga37s-1]